MLLLHVPTHRRFPSAAGPRGLTIGDVVQPGDAFESLSVIIPAYNAARCVADTLDAVQAWLAAHELANEVIVVDDGSADRTAEIVEQRGRGVRLLRNGVNRGKGYSVRAGMLASTGAWALFLDVDHSTHIRHLERFVEPAAGADVLIGSRRVGGARILRRQHRLRQLLGRSFPYLVRALALRDVQDTQCGFKLFRRAAVDAIFPRQRVERFAFDVEVLLLARRMGFRIAEIPVDWDNPTDSTLRISCDTLVMFVDVLRTVCRLRGGRIPDGDSRVSRE
ncbi:MAG: glycosyltransferase family 2 protein [Phycisphaerae bacterium]|nr:glycosyltransferase family 2 protein [Phycisphaerae bacterium]NUQ47323.1 glycosyltransferase family 2 protein [Phycisphaerae bacterium]